MLVYSDFLIQSKGYEQKLPAGHNKCGSYAACPMVWEIKEYVNLNNGYRVHLNKCTSCSSKQSLSHRLPMVAPLCGVHMHSAKVCVLENKSRIKNNALEAPMVSHYKAV